MPRVAIGSDRKQFFSSDPTKNKNESDPIERKNLKIAFNPIRFNPIRQYVNFIWLKRIGFSKIFASVSAIGSDFRPKMLPSAANRRTSDGLPIRRGHPRSNRGDDDDGDSDDDVQWFLGLIRFFKTRLEGVRPVVNNFWTL